MDGSMIVQAFDGRERRFRCLGCARVYQMACENGLLDQVLPQPVPKPKCFSEGMLGPGETAFFSLGGM
jgi:hypothetical protein